MTEPTAAPLPERLEEQAEQMELFAQAYPEALFPPLTPEQRAHAGDSIITRASAEMGRHFSRFATAAANALREAAAALAQRDGIPRDDARDAARYRWLRKANITAFGRSWPDIDGDAALLDAAVDAAMTSESGEQKSDQASNATCDKA